MIEELLCGPTFDPFHRSQLSPAGTNGVHMIRHALFYERNLPLSKLAS